MQFEIICGEQSFIASSRQDFNTNKNIVVNYINASKQVGNPIVNIGLRLVGSTTISNFAFTLPENPSTGQVLKGVDALINSIFLPLESAKKK